MYDGSCKRFTGDAFQVFKPQPKNKTFYERAPSWSFGLDEKKTEKTQEFLEHRKNSAKLGKAS
jgi:hypothetical protein